MLKNTFKLGQTCLAMALCLSVASCNKEEFYEKAYLETDPGPGLEVGGSVGGADNGSAQGGVSGGSSDGSANGGVVGGTDGSSAGGSSTGGSSTGSTDGGTVGGSTTGGSTTGSAVGGTVSGSTTGGSTTGSAVGGTVSGSTTGGTTTGGVVYKDAEEIFTQNAAQSKKLDIIWVIDNSGSMSDEQGALGENFNEFINSFITKKSDFRMGITTTDCSSSDKCGKMVSGSDTKLTSDKAAANKNQFLSDFNGLVQVGISGSGSEKGLMASNGFMSKYAATFIRPDAYLAVVILSDEEDQSSGLVAQYTDMLKGHKTNAGLVKVYSIVDVNKTNSGRGIATGGDRYIDASAKTAGVSSDIREDFAGVLSAMGDEILPVYLRIQS